MRSKHLSAVAVVVLLAAMAPSPLSAIDCTEDWTEPIACTLEVTLEREDGRERHRAPETALRVRSGERFDLLVTALDQEGARFPSERMVYGWETHRCEGLLSLEEHGEGHLEAEAGGRNGRCDLLVWVPGNLNLERRIRIEVDAEIDLLELARRHPEQLVRSVYRAVLGRDSDSGGLRNATAQLRRGRVEEWVEGLCKSPEYLERRRHLSAEERLEDLYLGLLDRRPKEAGHVYLELLRRGRCAEAALDIMRSSEFERRLREEEEGPERHHH